MKIVTKLKSQPMTVLIPNLNTNMAGEIMYIFGCGKRPELPPFYYHPGPWLYNIW
jgi:hypothetical protein